VEKGNIKIKTMKKVYIAKHLTEAHLIKGLLESYSIFCEVRGEVLFGVRGEVPMTTDTLPSVWVNDDDDFEKARAIVTDYDKGNKDHVPRKSSWKCQKCGEVLEPQFTECWNCGTERSHDA
jgi:hypothetical protein